MGGYLGIQSLRAVLNLRQWLPSHSHWLPSHQRRLPCHRRRLPSHHRWLPCHRRQLPSPSRAGFDGRQQIPPPPPPRPPPPFPQGVRAPHPPEQHPFFCSFQFAPGLPEWMWKCASCGKGMGCQYIIEGLLWSMKMHYIQTVAAEASHVCLSFNFVCHSLHFSPLKIYPPPLQGRQKKVCAPGGSFKPPEGGGGGGRKWALVTGQSKEPSLKLCSALPHVRFICSSIHVCQSIPFSQSNPIGSGPHSR